MEESREGLSGDWVYTIIFVVVAIFALGYSVAEARVRIAALERVATEHGLDLDAPAAEAQVGEEE